MVYFVRLIMQLFEKRLFNDPFATPHPTVVSQVVTNWTIAHCVHSQFLSITIVLRLFRQFVFMRLWFFNNSHVTNGHGMEGDHL